MTGSSPHLTPARREGLAVALAAHDAGSGFLVSLRTDLAGRRVGWQVYTWLLATELAVQHGNDEAYLAGPVGAFLTDAGVALARREATR